MLHKLSHEHQFMNNEPSQKTLKVIEYNYLILEYIVIDLVNTSFVHVNRLVVKFIYTYSLLRVYNIHSWTIIHTINYIATEILYLVCIDHNI